MSICGAISLFWLLVTSPLGFKARVGSLIQTFWTCTWNMFPEIQLWCDTFAGVWYHHSSQVPSPHAHFSRDGRCDLNRQPPAWQSDYLAMVTGFFCAFLTCCFWIYWLNFHHVPSDEWGGRGRHRKIGKNTLSLIQELLIKGYRSISTKPDIFYEAQRSLLTYKISNVHSSHVNDSSIIASVLLLKFSQILNTST